MRGIGTSDIDKTKRCSDPTLHNFPNLKPDTKCVWCGITVKEVTNKCAECGEEAEFFHSGCCNAYFEGVITKEGKYLVVCEKCHKPIGELKI